jgi:hypothetical protein
MSYSFVKLDKTITKSTIWAEDHATFRLWIYLLAEADLDGEVMGTIPGFAIGARITIEECERAIAKFEAPDPYSANKANEGRRIKPIDRGWLIINYRDHLERKGRDPEWQAERHRLNQQKYRERQRDQSVTGAGNECDRKSHGDRVVTTESRSRPRWERCSRVYSLTPPLI